MPMKLNLLVLRSAIPAELAAFYTHFGFVFDYHQHGNGPMHYSGTLDGLTLEIYPLKKVQPAADVHLRLGFSVPNLDEITGLLSNAVVDSPKQSEWGYRCVLADPEGRRVELLQVTD